jgi:hypothetical protein
MSITENPPPAALTTSAPTRAANLFWQRDRARRPFHQALAFRAVDQAAGPALRRQTEKIITAVELPPLSLDCLTLPLTGTPHAKAKAERFPGWVLLYPAFSRYPLPAGSSSCERSLSPRRGAEPPQIRRRALRYSEASWDRLRLSEGLPSPLPKL